MLWNTSGLYFISIQQLLCPFCALQYKQLILCGGKCLKLLWTLNVTADRNGNFNLKNSRIQWSSSVHAYMWSAGFTGNRSLSSSHRSINLFIDLSRLSVVLFKYFGYAAVQGVCSIVCLTRFPLFTLMFSCLNSRQTRTNHSSFNERLKKALWEHRFLLANQNNSAANSKTIQFKNQFREKCDS